jgi:hypothetical protein
MAPGVISLKASVVDAELEKLDLKLRTVRRATRMVSSTAYEAGETAGASLPTIPEFARLELHQMIENPHNSRRKRQ